ncbi:MAG: kelch repeat-containing protein [Candidatus Auribacterota bacterium]|nr:kelch repeat-containing protein [Candidatus Auribacterota bacterium]
MKTAKLVLLILLSLSGYNSFAQNTTSMIYDHGSGSIISYENEIYVIGGYSWNSNKSRSGAGKLEVYDYADDLWTELSPLPKKRSHTGQFILDGNLYVIGGFLYQGNLTNTVFKFSIESNTWVTMKPLPLPIFKPECVVLNNKAYIVFGSKGGHGNQQLDHTYLYEPSNDSWVAKTAMPLSVEWGTALAHNNKIYVFGGGHEVGYAIHEYRREVQIYNPDNDSWSYGNPLPQDFYTNDAGYPYYNISAVKYGDKAVIFSQASGSGTLFNKYVYIYSFPTDTWEKINMTGMLEGVDTSTILINNGCVLLDNYVYFGTTSGTYLYRLNLLLLGLTGESQWIDSDNDGIPDCWETENGLNPLLDDADDDADNDGLTNLQEFIAGTDPHNPDTDSDGMPDCWELDHALDPLVDDADDDADNDELTNLQEHYYRTNPRKTDTDGDGLSDGDEVLIYGTNPLIVDTDGDGITDYKELFVYFTDPRNPDTDADDMPDRWEIKHGFNPLLNEAENDADNDGLTNLEEYYYGTNPRKADTDGDGLTDYEELNIYVTDPLNPDTDGDGMSDGMEVYAGTDPCDPLSLFKVNNKLLSDGILVTWTVTEKAGRKYYIYVKTDIDWELVDYEGLQDDIIDNGDGTNSWNDASFTKSNSHRLYKVIVVRE